MFYYVNRVILYAPLLYWSLNMYSSLVCALLVGFSSLVSGDGSTTASVVVKDAAAWVGDQPVGYGNQVVMVLTVDKQGNIIASERL